MKVVLHEAPRIGGRRFKLAPGVPTAFGIDRVVTAFTARDVEEAGGIWIEIELADKRERSRSHAHEFGSVFSIGRRHAASHLETHYDDAGRVASFVVDLI